MPAAAADVAEARADAGFVEVVREVPGRKAGQAEQLPRGRGGAAGEEFATRVEPVFVEPLHEQRARGDAREEPVLVEGQRGLVAGVAAVGRTVPVGKGLGFREDGLAEEPLGERGAAAAGLVGDDDREAFVARAGEERREESVKQEQTIKI